MSAAGGLFVTGTDTGIGKTRVAAGLITGLARRGHRPAGMKPVASGCERDADGNWRNSDALALRRATGRDWPYEWINPFALPDPVAPQFAAERAGVTIDMAEIRLCYERLAAASEFVVVEGVGGWRVPLTHDIMTVDLVRALDLPVLVVVGLQLGCINHALLTAEALRADAVPVVGWVANSVDPDYDTIESTLTVLCEMIDAPWLGHIAFGGTDDQALVMRMERELLKR